MLPNGQMEWNAMYIFKMLNGRLIKAVRQRWAEIHTKTVVNGPPLPEPIIYFAITAIGTLWVSKLEGDNCKQPELHDMYSQINLFPHPFIKLMQNDI